MMYYLLCPFGTISSVVRHAKLTGFRSENCVWGLINAGKNSV